MEKKLNEKEGAVLEAALVRLGLDLEPSKRACLIQHLHLLEQKNKELNLTRIDSFNEGVVLHIEDSLSVLPDLQAIKGEFCDIGTGGGFPGVPLGIVSGKKGVFLESVKKKARVVQGFIEGLDLKDSLECISLRSEEYALQSSRRFECVVARAVSSMNVVLELAAPLLKNQGIVVCMRSSETSNELICANNAAEVLGLEFIYSREFEIGPTDMNFHRSVYVYKKVQEPAMKLPRRPGMAVKRPLV